jgi:hypothetical protein
MVPPNKVEEPDQKNGEQHADDGADGYVLGVHVAGS